MNIFYEYRGYIIQGDQDGYWNIIDSDNKIIGQTSTDVDAEEYIDNNLTQEIEDTDTMECDNNLPVKSTTLKNLGKKYKNCTGTAYILSSEYRNRYATVNGIGNINDPDLMIFKSAETARQNRLHRHSNFGIEEVHMVDGRIEF